MAGISLMKSRGRLVIDPFLRGRDQSGANSSERVPARWSPPGTWRSGRASRPTIKSRMLSSRVASEIILVNSSRLPAVSLSVAKTVRFLARQYSRRALSWASLEMMLPGVGRGSLTYMAAVCMGWCLGDEEEGELAAPSSSPFTVCQALSGPVS